MRLIDADTIPYLYPVDDDGNDGDGMTLQSTIDEVPTVKAIPLDRVEQIREEIEERVKPLVWKQKCVNDILEIIDKAIKEQNDNV